MPQVPGILIQNQNLDLYGIVEKINVIFKKQDCTYILLRYQYLFDMYYQCVNFSHYRQNAIKLEEKLRKIGTISLAIGITVSNSNPMTATCSFKPTSHLRGNFLQGVGGDD